MDDAYSTAGDLHLSIVAETAHAGWAAAYMFAASGHPGSLVGQMAIRPDGLSQLVIPKRFAGEALLIRIRLYGEPGSTIRLRAGIQGAPSLANDQILTGEVTPAGTWDATLHSIGTHGSRVFQSDDRFLSTGDRLAVTPEDGRTYKVWFGTTRQPGRDQQDTSLAYTAVRGAAVQYGSCDVFVPKSHRIGSTGSPWWKRLLTLTDDRLRILGVTALDPGSHWGEIANAIAEKPVEQRYAILFVHGYNVSFQEAALRAAQIGVDLGAPAVGFFSWPSQGTLDGYLADAASIEASEQAIAQYMSDFATQAGAETVHVIAHSMGNRGVLRAAYSLVGNRSPTHSRLFGQFILAAADVDVDTFAQRCAAYQALGKRTTLYVSAKDRAVEASSWLHRFPRVGIMPPVTVMDGIDTVNITNADLTLLGHGYVAQARDVLLDMHSLIVNDAPPDTRFGLRPMTTPAGKRYWAIGA